MEQRSSWVPVPLGSDFPIQNLPYGVFKRPGVPEARIGVAIGKHVLDLYVLATKGKFTPTVNVALKQSSLNDFMALGRAAWSATRLELTNLLDANNQTIQALRADVLVLQAEVELCLPAVVRDYTDFYSCLEHAETCTQLFNPGKGVKETQPNWFYMPIAYHGKASSIVVSGTPVRRPGGQFVGPAGQVPSLPPVCQAERFFDFELEMGTFVGPGNHQGEPIPVGQAHEHLFGMVLMNDWSSRSVQRWEMAPLGPFLSKNFATSISPWIVTYEALSPFQCEPSCGAKQDPSPLTYLEDPIYASYDIKLQVALQPADAAEPTVICNTNFRNMYWTPRQQLAHHTISGANMAPGDLLGSGTISGNEPGSAGCLLEASQNGAQALSLKGGANRTFLEDGDTVIFSGYCEKDGVRIGFGTCSGKVLPSNLAQLEYCGVQRPTSLL